MKTTRHCTDGFGSVEGLLLIIIVAIVGSIGWYVYNANQKTGALYNFNDRTIYKNSKTSSPASPQTEQYTNAAKTFSVAYPRDWKLTDCSGAGQTGPKSCTDFASPDMVVSGHLQTLVKGVDFSVSYQKAEYTSLDDYASVHGQDEYGTLSNISATKINGVKAMRAHSTGLGEGELVAFVNKGQYWEIMYDYPSNDSSTYNKYLKDFNAFVNSFKFEQ